jgi:hypothetical protein
MDALLDLEPPEETYQLEWDPSILNMPFFQRSNGEIDTAGVHSNRLRNLGLRYGYAVPPINHDFRAEDLNVINTFAPQKLVT